MVVAQFRALPMRDEILSGEVFGEKIPQTLEQKILIPRSVSIILCTLRYEEKGRSQGIAVDEVE